MKLTDFYSEVASRADTDKTEINVADTSRVLKVAFEVLNELPVSEVFDVIAKGMARAESNKVKAEAPTVSMSNSSAATPKKVGPKKTTKKATTSKK